MYKVSEKYSEIMVANKIGVKAIRIIENIIKNLENGKPEFTEILFFKIKKFNGKSI